MSMSITELERALRSLRLSGMIALLQARALAADNHEMNFIEAFGCLVQDELDRRRSRLLDRRFALSGLAPEGSRQPRCRPPEGRVNIPSSRNVTLGEFGVATGGGIWGGRRGRLLRFRRTGPW